MERNIFSKKKKRKCKDRSHICLLHFLQNYCLNGFFVKRSELQKSEHQNSKRTSKIFQSIRTLKVSFQFITTTTIRTSQVSFQFITTTTIITSKRTQKLTFDVLILPMASKKIGTSKIEISTTYGVLPLDTKACGALGGQVRVNQVRFHYVKLGQIRLV